MAPYNLKKTLRSFFYPKKIKIKTKKLKNKNFPETFCHIKLSFSLSPAPFSHVSNLQVLIHLLIKFQELATLLVKLISHRFAEVSMVPNLIILQMLMISDHYAYDIIDHLNLETREYKPGP